VERLEPRRLLSAVLAADINRVAANDLRSYDAIRVGNTAYFTAHDGVTGVELWKTDGTTAGTVLVKDIRPGLASGVGYTNFGATADGTVFFEADDGVSGWELWRTDGTAAGTVLVKDINPGPGYSVPSSFTVAGDRVYFIADDGVHGRELWVSDGTAGGTRMVVDLLPGAGGQSNERVPMAAVGDSLFFEGRDATRAGLWVTTGAAGNATYLGGSAFGSSVDGIAAFEGRVYFGTPNYGLWTSDGTTTTRVDSVGGIGSWKAVVSGGAFYFLAGAVYRIAPGTTTPVRYTGSFTNTYDFDVTANGDVYLTGISSATGREIFRAPAGSFTAALVKELKAGSGDLAPENLTAVGDTLFFNTYNSASGDRTLWATRGTAATTLALMPALGAPRGPMFPTGELNGRLFFLNTDPFTGMEFWTSDGTAAGTALLRDIFPGTGDSMPLEAAAELNGKLLFSADDGVHGTELWTYDRATGVAALAADLYPGQYGSSPQGLAVSGDVAYFTASVGAGRELYATDGTAAGTRMVKDIAPGLGSSYASTFVRYNGRTYFAATDQTTGSEIWVTDGTAEGTQLVKDILPGAGGGGFMSPVVFNGLLFFTATDAGGTKLWRTDGTAAGTQAVKDVYPGDIAGWSSWLTVYNGALYFAASDAATGTELWRTDGTAAGTVRVTDVTPGINRSSISKLTVAGPYLYFVADDGRSGAEPWRTDGTAAGTVRLADIVPGPGGSGPNSFVAMNGRAHFFAQNSAGGYELWQSAGTPQTTGRVAMLSATAGVGYPTALGTASGRLFFAADDGVTSVEVWSSDGTAAGTGIVQDLNPGPELGVWPSFSIVYGGEVYVRGTNSVSGRELWRFADTWAPVVWGQGLAGAAGSTTAAAVTFNEGVTVDLSRLVVTNRTTGQAVPAGSVVAAYDPATFTLTVSVSGAGGVPAADGDYRLLLPAGSVTDLAGNGTPLDVTADFFVLGGDANRDRVVDFADLLVVAKNYNKAGATWAEGDFTGDGVVNFADLLVLAKAYNKALPAAPAPVAAVAAAAAPVTANPVLADDEAKGKPVFSTARVAKPAPPPPKPAPAKPKAVAKPKGR
jgi:ELWxxDGT repeat protein